MIFLGSQANQRKHAEFCCIRYVPKQKSFKKKQSFKLVIHRPIDKSVSWLSDFSIQRIVPSGPVPARRVSSADMFGHWPGTRRAGATPGQICPHGWSCCPQGTPHCTVSPEHAGGAKRTPAPRWKATVTRRKEGSSGQRLSHTPCHSSRSQKQTHIKQLTRKWQEESGDSPTSWNFPSTGILVTFNEDGYYSYL